MPRLLQPNSMKRPKKPAKLLHAGILLAAAAYAAAPLGFRMPAVAAASANASTLPLNSSVLFVLDDTISSHAKTGTVVRAHLRDPLVVGGVTVAAAGTPVQIEVTQTSAAEMGNVDGYVDIFINPLPLADGKTLPLETPASHLNRQMTAGQQSTQAAADQTGDIFVPYYLFYHILRKGADVNLRPGTVIPARTGATIEVSGGRVTLIAPAPIVNAGDTPRPAFQPAPLETPPGYVPPTPKASPTVRPTQTP